MRMKKLTTLVVSAGMTLCMLAGCGSTQQSEKESTLADTVAESTIDTEESKTEEASSEAETKMQTTETEEVKSDTDAKSMGKVIASSVAIVEILDAMNVPMVGVPTSSYALPDSVANATEIGNPMSPDMEVIASLEPDYIISVNSLESELGEQFEALGAETYFADLSSYEGLKTTIIDLGELFGTQSEAESVIGELEEKEESVAASIEGKESPSVLVIFGAGNSFMVASESTYVGDLVRIVGGQNVITDAPSSFSPIDMEYLAGQNPDYILLMAHANPEESLAALQSEFESNEAWQNFDAVKQNRVYALETGYFGMSANLEAGEALEKLVEILYPEQ